MLGWVNVCLVASEPHLYFLIVSSLSRLDKYFYMYKPYDHLPIIKSCECTRWMNLAYL